MKKDQLTPLEESLCQAYLVSKDKSEALRKSKYKTDGWKPETVNTKAVQLFAKAKIKARVAELLEARSERTGIDADWLLKRLADDVTADLADIYNEAGGLKPIHEWPLIWRQGLVTGMDVEQRFVYEDGEKIPDGYITKIKVSDRVKRLEMVGRHINVQAFKDRIETEDVTDYAKLLENRASAAERLRNSTD